jgi:hypothetical protein
MLEKGKKLPQNVPMLQKGVAKGKNRDIHKNTIQKHTVTCMTSPIIAQDTVR